MGLLEGAAGAGGFGEVALAGGAGAGCEVEERGRGEGRREEHVVGVVEFPGRGGVLVVVVGVDFDMGSVGFVGDGVFADHGFVDEAHLGVGAHVGGVGVDVVVHCVGGGGGVCVGRGEETEEGTDVGPGESGEAAEDGGRGEKVERINLGSRVVVVVGVETDGE